LHYKVIKVNTLLISYFWNS